MGNELRADGRARAGPALDGDLRAEALGHFFRYSPCGDLLVAARRDRDDQPDRLGRVAVCFSFHGKAQKESEDNPRLPHGYLLARSCCRYCADCISCKRLTVRWNSALFSPCGKRSSGGASAETTSLMRSS